MQGRGVAVGAGDGVGGGVGVAVGVDTEICPVRTQKYDVAIAWVTNARTRMKGSV